MQRFTLICVIALLLALPAACALAQFQPDLAALPAPASLELQALDVTAALAELAPAVLSPIARQSPGQRAFTAAVMPLYGGRAVPFLAPYELRISCSGVASYWVAVPDRRGGWQLLGGPYKSVAQDTEQRIPIGLTPDAGDARGAFCFALITPNPQALQVDSLALLLPEPPAPGKPLACRQYISAADGTPLATTVYLPFEANGFFIPGPPYPAVLVRTPYRTEYIDPSYIALATQFNCAVVTQYFRGRPAPNPKYDGPAGQSIPGGPDGLWPRSGGEPTLFREHAGPEHSDALDTVDWLSDRPWYNGKLLASGPSALGLWIFQSAPALGDRLAAIYPQVAAGDVGHWAALENGCYKRHSLEAWLDTFGFPPELKTEALKNAADLRFWGASDFDQKAPQARCAGMLETCWWDVGVEAGIESWRALNERGGEGARGKQWLILGPWEHDGVRSAASGALSFPYEDPLNDATHLPLQWEGLLWAAQLLGRNPLYNPPQKHVLAYFIGEQGNTEFPQNTWVELADWPPAGQPLTLRLSADGRLSSSPVQAGELPFFCDPASPVPSLGGANIPVGGIVCGPRDQTPAEQRAEVLKFRSDTLAAPQCIAGEIRVRLWVSTDAQDSDVMVKLVDCYPAGTDNPLAGQNLLVCEGAMRLGYARQQAQSAGAALPPSGQPLELSFKIGDRAHVFGRGHRIGLDVQSGSHPRYDVNPGTGEALSGGKAVVQHNTLWISESRPGELILPQFLP